MQQQQQQNNDPTFNDFPIKTKWVAARAREGGVHMQAICAAWCLRLRCMRAHMDTRTQACVRSQRHP